MPPTFVASLGTALRGVVAVSTPSIYVWMIAGVCLLPSWASPGTAERGVVVAGTPLRSGVDFCWCMPPTVEGESEKRLCAV